MSICACEGDNEIANKFWKDLQVFSPNEGKVVIEEFYEKVGEVPVQGIRNSGYNL